MSRLWMLTAVLAFSTCSQVCFSQAPIERRTPSPPTPPGPVNAQWPSGTTVHRGSRLLVYTFDSYGPPFPCRVYDVEPDRLLCKEGNQAGLVIFGRADVAMLQRQPHAFPVKLLFQSGLAAIGIGILCGVDGGPVCVMPAIVGLSFVAAGVVLAIVQESHGWKVRRGQPLYQAPPSSSSP